MRNLLLIAVISFLNAWPAMAQVQNLFSFGYDNDLQDPAYHEQLVEDGTYIYGMTEYGGTNGSGGVYRVKPDGTDYEKLHDFDWEDPQNGSHPVGGLLLDGNVLYGMTREGGTNNDGCIFRINTNGTGFTILHNFDYATTGSDPKGTLILHNGLLYGTAHEGGTPPETPDEHYGTLFRLNTDGSGFTVLYNFQYATGGNPLGKLTPDGNVLYGTLSYGGPDSQGSLYKFDLSNSTFTVLHDFSYATGASPRGSVTRTGDYLYGTAVYGNYPNSAGVVYRYNINTDIYEVLHGFEGDYGKPTGDMVPSGDKLYFMCEGSGYVSGYVCALDINTNEVTQLISLEHETYQANHSRTGGSVLVMGNLLYVTVSGGPSQHGFMFSITKTGQDFTKRLIFRGTTDGRFPEGNLVAQGGYFYGMTPEGGAEEQGCIFRINQDGSGYTKLFDFDGSNGRKPFGSLLYYNGSFYGTASEGGDYGYGIVFTINPDGSGYNILHHFNESDGSTPMDNLMVEAGVLYGTTRTGEYNSDGTLFRLNTDGTGFATLVDFDYEITGGYPEGSLVKSGNKLFGMTMYGGTAYKGTIFSYDLNASDFTILHHFTGSDGSFPGGSLTLSGTKLYGMTSEGGDENGGVLFSIETNGNNYSVIRHFDNTARGPQGSVILSEGILYGLTKYGGGNDSGAAFSYDIAEDTFTVLGSFTGTNGTYPYGDPIRIGEDLYGMARDGGIIGLGNLFRYSSPQQWTGVSSTAWSDETNWSKGEVPSGGQDVVIPAAPANQPHVDLSPASPAQVNNLTIQAGASVTIDPGKALTVNGTLLNEAGNSGLILQSSASGTASLIHNTDFVNGTVKRYITGDADLTQLKYHLVSIPLAEENLTASLFNGSYLFEFDVEAQDWSGMGSDPETPVYNYQGYMIYYPAASTTYTFAGKLQNGSIGFSLDQLTNDYQLIPNPYPSAVDWDSPVLNKNALYDAIWIWNPQAGNYAAYGSEAGTNGGSRYIPQGQSFFVRASDTYSSVSLGNAARVHNNQSFYKDETLTTNQLRIKASGNGYSDEAIVRFTSDGLSGQDGRDVAKLTGNTEAPQLSTLADGHQLSINTLPEHAGSVSVPLNFDTEFSGQITFHFSELESFPSTLNLALLDEVAGKTINLRETPVYTFSHQAGERSDRFRLLFGEATGISNPGESQARMWMSNSEVFIHAPELSGVQARLEIYGSNGQKTEEQSLVLSELTTVKVITRGMVVARVTTSVGTMVCKGILVR
jgi:uncharacterized repeat protein (TIGR03803 family)